MLPDRVSNPGPLTYESGALPIALRGPAEINESIVQILLVLEVLFTQNYEVEDLFCCASSGSEPSLFFSNYFFSLGVKSIQDNFQHDFA